MNEIIELLKMSPPFILVVVLAYFLKVYFEKLIEGLGGRIEEIGKTSLEIKRGIREEERDKFVGFRVAVEEWEYFLQTALADLTMVAPSEAKFTPLYEEDKKLFLAVKIAVVKVSIYLRDKELEKQLMAAVIKIRNSYYPLIYDALPRLIDIQTKLIPIENKLKQFNQNEKQDMLSAPTENDRCLLYTSPSPRD